MGIGAALRASQGDRVALARVRVAGTESDAEQGGPSTGIPGVVDCMSEILDGDSIGLGPDIEVPHDDALAATRGLIARGFPAGLSSGLNVRGAIAMASMLGPGHRLLRPHGALLLDRTVRRPAPLGEQLPVASRTRKAAPSSPPDRSPAVPRDRSRGGILVRHPHRNANPEPDVLVWPKPPLRIAWKPPPALGSVPEVSELPCGRLVPPWSVSRAPGMETSNNGCPVGNKTENMRISRGFLGIKLGISRWKSGKLC
jgi:hypothetical protein